ncbi:MAG TPA: YggS family pyridoxal phosphate-dependent enzyme [Rudaea sp.]|uniref:YggS family pyridoxal phosphate-dependent enzyme n=1 Tax=Rudaea sp. TaxID=2136325 RepID=UPI002F927BDF
MESFDNYRRLCDRVDAAAQRAGHAVRLLAVSKMQPAAAVRAVAALGQSVFGENYVQEGLKKQRELADLSLEWHAIGPLQSNKCREIAAHFDWLQSLDRAKLIEPLNRARADAARPLQVLIQVNIDDEASKSGCAPGHIDALVAQISAAPHLALRGLMAIPAPGDPDRLRAAFARMHELYLKLRHERPEVDTLSMGMSADFEVAIAEGATLVRVGSALFGARG